MTTLLSDAWYLLRHNHDPSPSLTPLLTDALTNLNIIAVFDDGFGSAVAWCSAEGWTIEPSVEDGPWGIDETSLQGEAEAEAEDIGHIVVRTPGTANLRLRLFKGGLDVWSAERRDLMLMALGLGPYR